MSLKQRAKDDLNPYEDEEYQFVWGIISPDAVTTSKPNLYTMNDFEILYLKKEHKYMLSIEEIYQFDNNKDRIKYFLSFEKPFREFLLSKNLEAEESLDSIYNTESFSLYYPTSVISDLAEFKAKDLAELYHKYVLWLRMFVAIYYDYPVEIIYNKRKSGSNENNL